MSAKPTTDIVATTAQWGKIMSESPQDPTFVNSSVPKVVNDRVFLVGGIVQSVNKHEERGVRPLDLSCFNLSGVSESGESAVTPVPVDVYNPSNGHVPRRIGHATEHLMDGYLYVFGGQGILDDAFSYTNIEKEATKFV